MIHFTGKIWMSLMSIEVSNVKKRHYGTDVFQNYMYSMYSFCII